MTYVWCCRNHAFCEFSNCCDLEKYMFLRMIILHHLFHRPFTLAPKKNMHFVFLVFIWVWEYVGFHVNQVICTKKRTYVFWQYVYDEDCEMVGTQCISAQNYCWCDPSTYALPCSFDTMPHMRAQPTLCMTGQSALPLARVMLGHLHNTQSNMLRWRTWTNGTHGRFMASCLWRHGSTICISWGKNWEYFSKTRRNHCVFLLIMRESVFRVDGHNLMFSTF